MSHSHSFACINTDWDDSRSQNPEYMNALMSVLEKHKAGLRRESSKCSRRMLFYINAQGRSIWWCAVQRTGEGNRLTWRYQRYECLGETNGK